MRFSVGKKTQIAHLVPVGFFALKKTWLQRRDSAPEGPLRGREPIRPRAASYDFACEEPLAMSIPCLMPSSPRHP